MTQIHISREGNSFGPYSEDEVRQYLAGGTLLASDLAWSEGQAEWVPLGTLSIFQRAGTPPPAPMRLAPPSAPASGPGQAAGLPTVTLDLNRAVVAIKERTKEIRISTYVLTLACFFLPFMEVSCNHETLLTLTGVQMTTGTQIHSRDPFSGQDRTQNVSGDIFASIAILCVVTALVLSLLAAGLPSLGSVIASVLSIAALFVLKFRSEADVAEQARGAPIVVNFLYGFWFVILFVLVGLIISLLEFAKKKLR